MCEACQVVEVVEAVKARQRVPKDVKLPPFSWEAIWLWNAEMDDRVCKDCLRHDATFIFRGNHLRRKFPDLEVLDDLLILPNVHPNCRCVLIRYMGLAEQRRYAEEEPPIIRPGGERIPRLRLPIMPVIGFPVGEQDYPFAGYKNFKACVIDMMGPDHRMKKKKAIKACEKLRAKKRR